VRDYGPTDKTLAAGVVFKMIVITLAELTVVVLGVIALVQGNWLPGILLVTVGPLVAYIAADLATAVLVIPATGLARVFEWWQGRRLDREYFGGR
jgi:hypothetical protein